MPSSVDTHVILCSTARLARSLQRTHSLSQLKQGAENWPTLPISTLEAWLEETINFSLLSGEINSDYAPLRCLTPLQEQLIWQEVIASTLRQNALADLFDLTGLAESCVEANHYVVAWGLQLTDISQHTEETRQFLAWRTLFQTRCKNLHVLEQSRYLEWQLECLRKGASTLPQHIQFAGFLENDPQVQRLRVILGERSCTVNNYATGQTLTGKAQHLKAESQEDELRHMVAWAKAKLDENPSCQLAMVVPKLTILRNQLIDLLDDVFHSVSLQPSQSEMPRLYNFSLGTPLAQQQVIQTALILIRLFSSRQLNQQEIATALLSPYWSTSLREADSRAQLDAIMRENLPQTTKWPRLLRFFKQQSLPIAQLLDHCEAALALMQSQAKEQVPSVWAKTFKTLLETLAWPGERSESSHEYQARQAWDKALEQLASLDFLSGRVNIHTACTHLTRICQAQVFQPETEGEPVLQVLGIMEALSAPVEAMWVMGMNDDTWPLPARPNPLLPATLQRAARVANADSSVQTAFATAIHLRLMHSATELIFSSSLKQGDKDLRASPLMLGIPTYEKSLNPALTLAEKMAKQGNKELHWIDDYMAPPVEEGQHVRGGTGLLKAQAICPAWAFYQYRLGAKKLKTPKSGLDNAERGQLVHAALEIFWQNCTVPHLHTLSDSALQQAISVAASTSIELFTKQHEEVFSLTVLMLEHERLCRLLTGWLLLEKSRESTFKVLAREDKQKIIIQGIEVSVIIDRIDQFDDGSLMLIDYKTGQKPQIKNWAESRITEPQLPIYAAFSLQENAHVVAVCFGMVKTADHAFYGLSEDERVQGVKPISEDRNFALFANWQALQAHWKASIEAITLEIKTGLAAVQFENENDLTYCEVIPLLRLPERQLQFERQLTLKSAND